MSEARPKTGLDLSLVQVVAGSGAALTAALLGSLFGIAGTLLGTAVGSTVGTICTAVYTHQLRRTHDRLQRRGGFPAGWPRPSSLRRLPWFRVLAAAAVVFGVSLAALTVVESLAGRPLSSATGGSHAHAGGRTSVSRVLPPDLPDHLPTPRPVTPTTPAVPIPEQSSPPSDASSVPAATQSDGEASIPLPPDVASATPSAVATPAPTASETTTSETPPPPSVDPTSIDQPTVPPPSAEPPP
jgi:hypothetical protein